MPTTISNDTLSQYLDSLKQLQRIRNFNGEPVQFWRILLETLILLSNAEAGLICLRADQETAQWKTIVSGPDDPQSVKLCKKLSDVIEIASKGCSNTGYAFLPAGDSSIIAVNLMFDVDIQKCIGIFHLNTNDKNEASVRINALLSASDIPAQYRMQKSAHEAMKNQSHLTDILDLMVILNSQHRFVAAAMTVCNELASRYSCNRVSLGWFQKGYVRVKAMSHTDHFEKKMEAVERLELAMEEALDQEADIVIPASDKDTCVTRDHQAYAKAQDVLYMATFLLRKKDKVEALCSFEKSNSPFSEIELRQLRVTIDQISTRLIELRHRDRWIGARLSGRFRDMLSRILGYEHTWPKFFGILGAAFLLFVTLIPVRYRVSSPMILRTDDISYITAPFDGYIDSVGVKPGELVKANATLLSLDKKDLLLEEAGLLAEQNREQREIEKARAAGELADMCIAQARYDQVAAKLDVTRYKLQQAAISIQHDGIVIEGDQQEKIGSPVKQGEILFRIGRIKDIYAEAKVTEGEIQNIKTSAAGQIALSSRPQDLFNVKVALIEPSAVVTSKDNSFLVRCKFIEPVPSWFRPGMTGVSKINAGRKTIIWIISHRTIDFIRLKLWW